MPQPPVYSTSQKVFLVTQMLTGHSARKARDLFAVQYPDSPIPSLHTVQKCLQRYQQDGCLNNDHLHLSHKKRSNYHLTEDIQTKICASVEVNPTVSSHEIAKELGISKTSVLKTLKESGYHQHREYAFEENGKKKTVRLRKWSRLNPADLVVTEYTNKRDCYKLTEETQSRICDSVDADPNISSREIAEELGISKTTVLETLKASGYQHYRESGIEENGKKKSQRLGVWSKQNPREMVTTEYCEDIDLD